MQEILITLFLLQLSKKLRLEASCMQRKLIQNSTVSPVGNCLHFPQCLSGSFLRGKSPLKKILYATSSKHFLHNENYSHLVTRRKPAFQSCLYSVFVSMLMYQGNYIYLLCAKNDSAIKHKFRLRFCHSCSSVRF